MVRALIRLLMLIRSGHSVDAHALSFSSSLRIFTSSHSFSLTHTYFCYRCTLPYIRTDIPVVIVFRALGFTADRDIIEHIVYDTLDTEMMERFRPSLQEASPIQNQIVALDYLAVRGSTPQASRPERIRYARDILQKEVLPHVGVEENNETKKAFYMGYIVHKILMCSLGRLEEDDRGLSQDILIALFLFLSFSKSLSLVFSLPLRFIQTILVRKD